MTVSEKRQPRQVHVRGLIGHRDATRSVKVVDEEATEDMQTVGGVSALGTPYLETSITTMIQKRGGWLMLLFLAEILTAAAMG